MTKNYRRAARGGRFKRQDFGDLGLRAYKEQQDTIIQSLKLQQARSKEYAGDHITNIGNIARSEEQNRNLLQDLENDLYKSKVKAIEKNQAREVAALKGKADEYGKQAQFWKELAPSLSKSLGQLAQSTTDLVGFRQASHYLENNPTGVDISQQIGENGYQLVAKGTTETVEEAIKNDDLPKARKVNSIPLLAKRHVGRLFSKNITDNWNIHHDNIKEGANAKGNYDDDPREYARSFILLLAKERGLSANNPSVKDAINFAQTKVNADVLSNELREDYIRQEDHFSKHLENFVIEMKRPPNPEHEASGLREKMVAFMQLKNAGKLRLHKDENNKITRPTKGKELNDKIHGVLPAIRGLIEKDAIVTIDDLDEFLNNEIYVPTKFQKGEAWEEDRDKLEDLIRDREKEQRSNLESKIKQDDRKTLIEIQRGAINDNGEYEEWNWNDFSPNGHRSKAYQKLHSLGTGSTQSKKWLAEKLSYNTDKGRDWNAVNQELQRYAHQGNFLGFMSIYNNLTTAQKEGNTHLYDTLAELNAANIQSFDDLSNISKAKISGENAHYKLPGTRGLNASETLAKDAYGQTVLAHFWALESQQEKKGTIKDRWEEAVRKADDDWSYKDNTTGILGRGLLRRKPPGIAGNDTNQVVYMAYETEKLEGQATSTKDLFWKYQDAIVPKGQKVYNLDKGTLSPKLSYIIEKNRILTNDELDKVIEAVTLGEDVYRENQAGTKGWWTISIPPNANVKELVKLHNERNQQQISQREIYQAILVKHGIKLKVPENAVDLARAYLKTPNPDTGGERALALGREDDTKFKSESEILIRSQYKWYQDNIEKEGTFDWSKLKHPEINQFLMERSNGN